MKSKVELPPPIIPVTQRVRAGVFTPHNMSKLYGVSREAHETVQRICLSIFSDMINGGQQFPDVLASLYYTGAQHAIEIMKEKNGQTTPSPSK